MMNREAVVPKGEGPWQRLGHSAAWGPAIYQVGLCVPCSTKEYSVILGTSQLKPLDPRKAISIPVRDIIMHPKYWGRTFTMGDVALLRLHAPAIFSKYVQPICLPEPTYNLKVGTQCWVTGWSQAKQRFSGEQEWGGCGQLLWGLA